MPNEEVKEVIYEGGTLQCLLAIPNRPYWAKWILLYLNDAIKKVEDYLKDNE